MDAAVASLRPIVAEEAAGGERDAHDELALEQEDRNLQG